MKLSISNIAWSKENDETMLRYLKEIGISAIEIAPTRIVPQDPYNNLLDAESYMKMLKSDYGIDVVSMQSILYGKTENIFDSFEERQLILNYLKKAIDFANEVGSKNLVFGCPKNRNMNDVGKFNECEKIAISFFKELGDYAYSKNTVISIEPNPVIYNTNYINRTADAFDLAKKVDSKGFLVNIDLGTIIYNEEEKEDVLKLISSNIDIVNHIHISEPNLKIIEKRYLHKKLFEELTSVNYNKFISIEMSKQDDLENIKKVIEYCKETFKC